MELRANTRRLLAITRAKGKMYELGVPEEHHLAVPDGDEPDAVLLSAVAILGDAAAYLSTTQDESLPEELLLQLESAARYFDAFLESRFEGALPRDLALLASASYYLASRPGSSAVFANRLAEVDADGPIDSMLEWVLKGSFDGAAPEFEGSRYGPLLHTIALQIAAHFQHGEDGEGIVPLLAELRERAYEASNSRDVLFADLIVAISQFRLAVSVWVTIPSFTGQPVERWRSVLSKPGFPMELWPSQLLIGQAGLMAGSSGAILMPTSAGKTRSIEMLIRSGFISERFNLAVVVAPFRALAHEIGANLRTSFKGEPTRVNELSDALQLDFDEILAEILGGEHQPEPVVLVLTPEKLHFVLRQVPELAAHIGFLVYDECHQFDSGTRGVTYELLLTEIAQLVQEATQSILISAVMPNAIRLAGWALGPGARVVDGSSLMPTSRAIAFTSWLDRRGRLELFDSLVTKGADYFVPRAIEVEELQKRPREIVKRVFPVKGDTAWKDVSLYLGLRLAPSGTVAVFCGRKDTANGMARRTAEIYARGFGLDDPAKFSDLVEVEKLRRLTEMHYGPESDKTIAAGHGVFVHHGTTPHGLRISIEYAMQHDQIRFVVCTSTLAQGVNLPIRYLIVSGTKQAGDDIRARDFQNLLGRAGRAGMHTEGLVIFGNPLLYDRRLARPDVFHAAVDLLSPSSIEDIGSSLLETISAIRLVATTIVIEIDPASMIGILFADPTDQRAWAERVASNYGRAVTADALLKVVARRREVLAVVESHLMAMRGTADMEAFRVEARALSERTLAYELADELQRSALALLFERIAILVNGIDPDAENQSRYARTLLSASKARRIFEWVDSSRALLATLPSPSAWLEAAWPLFGELSDNKFFHSVEPEAASYQIAESWLNGQNYLWFAQVAAEQLATKPWGRGRQKLSDEEIFSFCEQTLSFECSLFVSAIALALGEEDSDAPVSHFLKALKYGLPDPLAASIYEAGIADRALAVAIRTSLVNAGYDGVDFAEAWTSHGQLISDVVDEAPSFFGTVLSSRR